MDVSLDQRDLDLGLENFKLALRGDDLVVELYIKDVLRVSGAWIARLDRKGKVGL